MYVPLGVVLALLPVFVTGALGAATWVVGKITRHAELIAQAAERLDAADRIEQLRFEGVDARVARLESWRDGYRAGQASTTPPAPAS